MHFLHCDLQMITDIVLVVWNKAEENNEHWSHCKWEHEAIMIILSKQHAIHNMTPCSALKMCMISRTMTLTGSYCNCGRVYISNGDGDDDGSNQGPVSQKWLIVNQVNRM